MKSALVIRMAALLLVGVLVLGGAMVFRGTRSAAKVVDMHGPAARVVMEADIYERESAYIDDLFEQAHPEATRAVGASVGSGETEERYYTVLFQAMVNKAKADGKPEIGRSLRTFAVGRGFVEVKF